jgi:hypothetical protein
MSKQKYSTAKSQFVQQKMKEGMAKEEARKAWKKSPEKKAFSATGYGSAQVT